MPWAILRFNPLPLPDVNAPQWRYLQPHSFWTRPLHWRSPGPQIQCPLWPHQTRMALCLRTRQRQGRLPPPLPSALLMPLPFSQPAPPLQLLCHWMEQFLQVLLGKLPRVRLAWQRSRGPQWGLRRVFQIPWSPPLLWQAGPGKKRTVLNYAHMAHMQILILFLNLWKENSDAGVAMAAHPGLVSFPPSNRSRLR